MGPSKRPISVVASILWDNNLLEIGFALTLLAFCKALKMYFIIWHGNPGTGSTMAVLRDVRIPWLIDSAISSYIN